MIGLLLKFTLFVLSMSGYCMLLNRKYSVYLEFTPILFCASISNVLFLAGILNLLPETVLGIWLLGCILFCTEMKSLRKAQWNIRNCMLAFCFGSLLLYFSWLLRGAILTDYDNFSHWAIVVKDMLLQDRMPNFEDTLIMFQAYPLGSSLFIYYVCKIVGTTEACFLWAQIILMLSALFSGLVFVTKKNRYAAGVWAIYAIYALTVNISIWSLLVDTLLPLVGLAAFIILYKYRKQPKQTLIFSSVLFPFLLNIKNSGIFFYLICLGILIFYLNQHGKIIWRQLIGWAVFPAAATNILWSKHVKLVFAAGQESKHAMSLENYAQMFAGKSSDDILFIIQKWQDAFFSLSNTNIQLILFTAVLVLLASLFHFLLDRKTVYWKRALGILGFVAGTVLLYQIGLLGMYLFSMPTFEAKYLASYDRYQLSMNQFLLGIVMIKIIDSVKFMKAESDRKYVFPLLVTICIICAFPIFPQSSKIPTLYKKPAFENTDHAILKEIEEERELTGADTYVYYDPYSDYLSHLIRYELWTENVRRISKLEADTLNDELSSSAYLFLRNIQEDDQKLLA